MLFQTEVIVGTYERVLLGFVVVKENEVYSFVNTFSMKDQEGSLQCITRSKKFLAVGSSDETVALYDMEERQSTFSFQNSGVPKCMDFTPDGSFLLVGGANGLLSMYQAGSWSLEKNWTKAHAGNGVSAIACHNSSKLAISLGSEGTVHSWDLVKGRLAYAKSLRSGKSTNKRQLLKMSPSGAHFALSYGCYVYIYLTSNFRIVYSFKTKFITTCISFVNDTTVGVGINDGSLQIHDFVEGKQIVKFTVDSSRIQGIIFVSHETESFIITASSCGKVSLWKLQNNQLMALCKFDTKCRITCISSYDLQTKGEKKIEGPIAEEYIKKSRKRKAAEQKY